MKKIIAILFILSFPVLTFSQDTTMAQNPAVSFDTIRFLHKGHYSYQVPFTTVKEINYELSKIKLSKSSRFSIGGSIGRGALTLFTGVGWDNTKKVNWVMPGLIQTDPIPFDWNVEVYFQGSATRETKRVKESKGNYSLDNHNENIIYWDQEADGIIFGSGYTIGKYRITNNPRSKPELDSLSKKAYEYEAKQAITDPLSRLEVKFIEMDFMNRAFAFYGKYLDVESVIFYNHDLQRAYLFEENELRGIYQHGKSGEISSNAKAAEPMLLLKTNLSEDVQLHFLLLALVSQWFKDSVNSFK
jgi:hypothetical protein